MYVNTVVYIHACVYLYSVSEYTLHACLFLVTKSSHGNDVVPVPDEIGTSMYDEPAPPGMELESTVTTGVHVCVCVCVFVCVEYILVS